MTKVSAYGGSKAIADTEEGLRKHADVLEVDDPDFPGPDVAKELVLANVRMIDDEIVRKRYARVRA